MSATRVPFEYVVLIGDPQKSHTKNGFPEYVSLQTAPASLCSAIPSVGDPRQEIHLAALAAFQESFGAEMVAEILVTYRMKCLYCPKMAMHAIGFTEYRLHRETYGHTPAVIHITVPLCSAGSVCERKGQDALGETVCRMFPGQDTPQYGRLEGCRTCWQNRALQVYVGCHAFWYCSRKCQISDRGRHRIVCRIFKREREMKDMAEGNVGSVEMERHSKKVDEENRAQTEAFGRAREEQ